MILVLASQLPLLGIRARYAGNRAKKKNGRARPIENINMPKIGQLRSPWIEPAKSAPMNGPVQAKDASANTSPMTSVPSKPPRLETLLRDVRVLLGMVISKTPSRLNPNATKTAVISRLTGTLDPS